MELASAVSERPGETEFMPDQLVEQFMFVFTHRNGPQVLMYMAEPLRRTWWQRYIDPQHPDFWASSPWFPGYRVRSRRATGAETYGYRLDVELGLIGNTGKVEHDSFPMELVVSRHRRGWLGIS